MINKRELELIIEGYPRKPNGGTLILLDIIKKLEFRNTLKLVPPRISSKSRKEIILSIKSVLAYLYAYLFQKRPKWIQDETLEIKYDLFRINPNVITLLSVINHVNLVKTKNTFGNIIYVCQHIEDWVFPSKEIKKIISNTNLKIIYVSKFLQNSKIVGQSILKHNKTYLLQNKIDIIEHEINFNQKRIIDISFMDSSINWKNIDFIIGLIKKMKRKNPNLNIARFGSSYSEKSKTIRHLYNDYGWLNREEVSNLFAKSKIFISSSYKEGFCLPVAEAMCCGARVVTSDSGGVRDFSEECEGVKIIKNYDESIWEISILKFLEKKEIDKNNINQIKIYQDKAIKQEKNLKSFILKDS